MRIVRDRTVSGVGSQVYGPPEAPKTSWWQNTGKGGMWQLLAGYGMQGYQAREQRKHTESLARMRSEVQKAALAKGAGWIPGEYSPYNVAQTSRVQATTSGTNPLAGIGAGTMGQMLLIGGLGLGALVVVTSLRK